MPELVFTGYFMVDWRTGGVRVVQELQPGADDELPVGFSLKLTVPRFTPPWRAGAALVPEEYSEREVKVLELLADGCSTAEIAAQVFVSPATAKRYLVDLYQKLHARNNREAVAKGIRGHLI
jgi:DNA-binding NarL/FixJ family response regulator